VKALLSEKQKKESQRGFTLVELMIAIAVSAMIMVGSMQLLSHMVVTSAQNRANTMAMLQVQYVGFWITEDVVQARPAQVTLTDPLNPGASHFPLTIQWTQWNGVEHKVEYSYSVEGDETWKLSRHEWYTPKGGSEVDNGMTVVGESLDPAGTRCEWDTGGNATNVLKLDVTANVDGKLASRTYEINPRSK
jgi:prepilin-type N-terminal cleavage/methylation domain-containing protein